MLGKAPSETVNVAIVGSAAGVSEPVPVVTGATEMTAGGSTADGHSEASRANGRAVFGS
jgi:hypothetical protein